MTVKVIVTDMDGTFLDDAKQYDRDRFQAQFEQLNARGIEFVVASGNQYYQLISSSLSLKIVSPSWRKTARWCSITGNTFSTAN